MRLWIAVYLTQPSLDALNPLWSDEAAPAVAVLDHEQVVAVTPEARRLGVRPGMRKKSAGAVAPHASFIQRDAEREQQLLKAASLAMLQYTPDVAFGPEASLLLEVGPSLRAFGGPASLCRRIRRSMGELGCQSRLGMAPTALGAWLLAARATPGPRRVLRLPALVRNLGNIPCTLLPAARPHREWLEGIGCRTLAALLRLPRAGMQRRCGPDLLRSIDQAYGHHPEVFEWIRPPLDFSARIELLARIEHAPAVLTVARRLIQQLAGWLNAVQAAVCAVVLVLEHERGRHARPPTRLSIAPADPEWQPDHLLHLLKEHLGRLSLQAPVIAVGLQTDRLAPREPAPDDLFIEPGGEPAREGRLLDLLTARLGPGQVLAARPQADHRPEAANRWLPALGPFRSAATAENFSAERPFWLLQRPIPLVMREHRPYYGTSLRILRGPERIEAGWWDGSPISRDYFVAESEDKIRYWIYLDRSLKEPRWYLHGLYA